eukprot:scaffold866_cov111-Isochrysis_galbana.AAC.7
MSSCSQPVVQSWGRAAGSCVRAVFVVSCLCLSDSLFACASMVCCVSWARVRGRGALNALELERLPPLWRSGSAGAFRSRVCLYVWRGVSSRVGSLDI